MLLTTVPMFSFFKKKPKPEAVAPQAPPAAQLAPVAAPAAAPAPAPIPSIAGSAAPEPVATAAAPTEEKRSWLAKLKAGVTTAEEVMKETASEQ